MLVEIVEGELVLVERPESMPPSLLEIKRFVAGYGDFGGSEGATMDMARIESVSLPQPPEAVSRVLAYVNADALPLGMGPNCFVGKNLIFGPMLICGQTATGLDRVLTVAEAGAFDLVWGGQAYPELRLR